ncbi:helix-turn-helix transcriptional regulator [Mucilaginibacter sp. 21P]|uniref:ArsR/SmtB family transcription factor n=1 Tax=Mucilaginibacter sp. 21P TaxID=2778902 RepID=UPI001C583743|nr:metalloregulator ArsR/SmtB family transcription factor [Mucilaginibacter sp. 21P]QXV67663.1 helix-turn-helix transcriptional regulator [Mucilaginibacter sp. 21P]
MQINDSSHAALFHAIGDPNRREILMLLSQSKYTITELAENFDISRPAISKHIKVLAHSGFVSIDDIGRERYCSLNKAGFQAIQEWLNYFEKFWHNKLQNLEELLALKENGTKH